MPRPQAKHEVAIHEAGHAVVALRRGVALRYVTLAPRVAGHVGHVVPRERTGGWDCRDIMAMCAGGPIAHDIVTGCKDRILVTAAATVDFTELRDCARLIRDGHLRGEHTGMELPARPTVRRIAELSWMDTYRIVVADWSAILAVADALLASRRALTGTRIRELIDTADSSAPPRAAQLAEKFWPSLFKPGWWIHEPRCTAA